MIDEPAIRPYGKGDELFILDMLALTLQAQPQYASRSIQDLRDVAVYEFITWRQDRDFAFVAGLGEDRVGVVWLHGGGEVGGKTFTVGLAVLPRYQGKGIGTKLMEYGLEFCRENKALSVDLKVYPANEKAIRLYRRFGFETGLLEMKKRF